MHDAVADADASRSRPRGPRACAVAETYRVTVETALVDRSVTA